MEGGVYFCSQFQRVKPDESRVEGTSSCPGGGSRRLSVHVLRRETSKWSRPLNSESCLQTASSHRAGAPKPTSQHYRLGTKCLNTGAVLFPTWVGMLAVILEYIVVIASLLIVTVNFSLYSIYRLKCHRCVCFEEIICRSQCPPPFQHLLRVPLECGPHGKCGCCGIPVPSLLHFLPF